MNLRELNAVLRRLDRTRVAIGRPLSDGGEVLAADPWRLLRPGDRGEWSERHFRDEDDACRWLLTRELMTAPVALPPGVTPAPGILADIWTSGHGPHGGRCPRDEPPALKWKRRLWPLSTVSARGCGVAVLTETSSLYEHGTSGCLHLAGLDVATGRQIWSVPVWPPTPKPVVEVLVDTVVVCTRSWWSGFDLWTGAARWQVPAPSAEARVVAQGSGLAVVAMRQPKGFSRAGLGGIDLRTGELVWQYPGTYSDLTVPYRGIPDLSRVLAITAGRGRIAVDAITVADGSVRRLFDVAEPAGFRGATMDLIDDQLRPDGDAGYLILRSIRGVDHRGLGDLILLPGRDTPIVVPREPAGHSNLGMGPFACSAGDSNYLATRVDASQLMTLLGETVWELPGDCSKPHRMPGLTLVEVSNAGSTDVALVDDEAVVRWRTTGHLLFVHDGVARVREQRRYAGYDAQSGDELWSTTDVKIFQYPNRNRGFHPDDQCVLIETESELECIG